MELWSFFPLINNKYSHLVNKLYFSMPIESNHKNLKEMFQSQRNYSNDLYKLQIGSSSSLRTQVAENRETCS